jgi:hypothetical protein
MTRNKNSGYRNGMASILHRLYDVIVRVCVLYAMSIYVEIFCKWKRKANIAAIKVMNESRSSVSGNECLT